MDMQQHPTQHQSYRQCVVQVLDRLVSMIQSLLNTIVTGLVHITAWTIIFPRYLELMLLIHVWYVWVLTLLTSPRMFQLSRGYVAMEQTVISLAAPPQVVWAALFIVATLPDALGLLWMTRLGERCTDRYRLIGYSLRIVGMTALFFLLGFVSDMIQRSSPGTTGSRNYRLIAYTAGVSLVALILLLSRELARYRNAHSPQEASNANMAHT
jgi:hypothetical protein